MKAWRKRRGFTLIEVIVALGIFMVVLLALLGNYYSYYNSIKKMTYRAIGQNLAEVLIEDVRSLPVSIISDLVKGGQYPKLESASEGYWQYYTYSTEFPGCFEVSETHDNSIPDAIPFSADTNSSDEVYNSGEVDASYRIQHIESVFGTSNLPNISSDLLIGLPNNIVITPVHYFDEYTGEDTFDYTVLLNKEIFPYYKKRIIITDLTPSIDNEALKIFNIEVIISWNNGQQEVILTGEKSFGQ